MNEPVAYMCLDTSRLRAGHCVDKVLRFNKPKQPHVVDIVPLYPKREWIGLTDAEVKEIWLSAKDHGDDWLDVQGIAQAIETKLKERNT